MTISDPLIVIGMALLLIGAVAFSIAERGKGDWE